MTTVPSNLRSIITDFTADLSVVFPEYAFMWSKWSSASDAEYEKLYAHCLAIYPERFFDIMYTNADIFDAGSKHNVDFLPNVDFRLLFNCPGVSEKTKTSIWKYLQLILFTAVGSVNDPKRFGDAANIFEAMDENELQSKMAETLESVGEFFKNMEYEDAASASADASADALKEANENADIHEKEHVTTYIIKKYKTLEFEYPVNYEKYKNIDFSNLHLSLDTPEDYILLQKIYKNVYKNKNDFGIEDVLEYLNSYMINEKFNLLH